MQNFIEIKKIYEDIVDASMFYWGLSKSLEAYISKFKKIYPFHKYALCLQAKDNNFFESMIFFYNSVNIIEKDPYSEHLLEFIEHLQYLRSYTLKRRKILREFLDNLMVVNNFILNEWCRAHMIELVKDNLAQCENIYFLSTELVAILSLPTDEHL